jgi:hypothetical protein
MAAFSAFDRILPTRATCRFRCEPRSPPPMPCSTTAMPIRASSPWRVATLFVERVSRGDGRMAAGVAITRMRKLVSEGWRVVWLASGDTAPSPAAILGDGGAIHICGEICRPRLEQLIGRCGWK